MRRRYALLVALTAALSLGAEVRTTNFVVHTADPQVCQQVAQWAEHYRKEKALLWLGQEMPPWPQPCPLYVSVNMKGPSGATSFHFGQGRVLGMKMEIEGNLERLLNSVLPHEVTHTVFAHHFRQPVPRWADEGGSVLSEDNLERERHDALVRQILNRGQQIPLRTLMGLKEYPPQVMCLYAQGFSMSEFLVSRSDRRTFLAFVGHGMQAGWDNAIRSYYGHNSVEEMEQAWLKYLRETRKPGSGPNVMMLAQNTPKAAPAAQPTGRTMVRLTVPPAQPFDPAPTVRGARPAPDQVGQRFGTPTAAGRPTHLPPAAPAPTATWQPSPVQLQAPVPLTQAPAAVAAPPVQLGTPEFGTPAPLPPNASPIGFPR